MSGRCWISIYMRPVVEAVEQIDCGYDITCAECNDTDMGKSTFWCGSDCHKPTHYALCNYRAWKEKQSG